MNAPVRPARKLTRPKGLNMTVYVIVQLRMKDRAAYHRYADGIVLLAKGFAP